MNSQKIDEMVARYIEHLDRMRAANVLTQDDYEMSLRDLREWEAKKRAATKMVTLGEQVGQTKWGTIYAVATEPRSQVAQNVGELDGVLKLFARAEANLKAPAIVLAVPAAETVLRLTIAGARAKVPGSITVTDNDRFVASDFSRSGESREWLGRVLVTGTYEPARAANGRTEAIAAQLRRFAAEPAKVAKESAELTGRCVFCNQRLGGESETAKKSLAVGYGETCARNFGLPWGQDKLDIGEGA